MSNRILVVDDEESIRFTFRELLTDAGFQVDTAESLIEAAAKVGETDYDAIFLDILLGRDSGLNLLRVMHEQSPNCPITMVTGSPEIKTAAEAVRHGAFDYLVKPLTHEDLVRQAQRAVNYKAAIDQKERYQERLRAVFEGVREGLLVFTADLKLVEMNYAAMQMLGRDESCLGQELEALAQDGGSNLLKALQGLIESRFGGELYRLQIPSATGEDVFISINISPLTTAKGQEADLVVVLRDESQPVKELASA